MFVYVTEYYTAIKGMKYHIFLHPCLHGLAIIYNAARNTGVHLSFQLRVFIFSKYMPRNEIFGSYSSCIFRF